MYFIYRPICPYILLDCHTETCRRDNRWKERIVSITAHKIIEVDCPVGKVDRSSVLSYLGKHQELQEDAQLDAAADRMIDECARTLHPRGTYKLFNPAICTLPPAYTEPGIKLVGTLVVLKGQRVYNRMSKAAHCVMMAASAGDPDEIEELRQRTVATRQDEELFEACLQATAQKAADMTNAAIVQQAMELGLYTDDFLSPGTDDFPLEQNDQIHFYTQAESRLGMALDDASKPPLPGNVLGIVGMYDKSQKGRRRACGKCKFRDFCSIRAIGMNCHGRKGKFKTE